VFRDCQLQRVRPLMFCQPNRVAALETTLEFNEHNSVVCRAVTHEIDCGGYSTFNVRDGDLRANALKPFHLECGEEFRRESMTLGFEFDARRVENKGRLCVHKRAAPPASRTSNKLAHPTASLVVRCKTRCHIGDASIARAGRRVNKAFCFRVVSDGGAGRGERAAQ